MSSDILRRTFYDVCNGYSRGTILGRASFVRHISHSDQIDLDEKEKEFYNFAQKRGLPTEQSRLEFLKKEGRWKNSDEDEIKKVKLSIESLMEGRKNAPLPSMVSKITQQIEEDSKIYDKKMRERNDLLGLTCENYAQRRLNEYYIVQSLYSDASFSRPLFSTEDFEDLSENEIGSLIMQYNIIMDVCSELNIKKLALQDFFQSHYVLCNNDFSAFYGKPICKLTLLQIRLANYARYFKNIFENYDTSTMPKALYDDPDKIVDWVKATDRAKKEMEKTKDAAMSGQAGMTKEDRKALGIKAGPDPLMEAMQKKGGGSLSKEDIMKALGRM